MFKAIRKHGIPENTCLGIALNYYKKDRIEVFVLFEHTDWLGFCIIDEIVKVVIAPLDYQTRIIATKY